MFLKQILSTFLLTVSCLTAVAQMPRMFFVEPYAFTVISEESKTAEVSYLYSDYSGPTDITLPSTAVDEYGSTFTITSVGNWFPNNAPLTSIVIPNTVTELCDYAFEEATSLKSVTLGSSVSIIGNATFRGCISLEDINVVAGNPTYASDGGVLYNGDKTSLILCPKAKSSVTIPNSVTVIGEDAF